MIHLYTKQVPLASTTKQLRDRYDLLMRRRSSLIHEMSTHPATSRHLHSLHKSELKILRTHLLAIENFLQNYGFINQRGG